MKWNGIVSQRSHLTIASAFATANTAHATSMRLGRGQPVARMANGLDRSVGAELLAQASHAHLDDVRPRVEVVAPHLREQALAADDLAGMQREVVQQPELAVGQVGDERADACLPA